MKHTVTYYITLPINKVDSEMPTKFHFRNGLDVYLTTHYYWTPVDGKGKLRVRISTSSAFPLDVGAKIKIGEQITEYNDLKMHYGWEDIYSPIIDQNLFKNNELKVSIIVVLKQRPFVF
uniref:Uncharacterized protein n=1 Tax=Panagrolaimus sp. JU765 TaxID=591449 RepID=A0AC34RAI0_9BILA